MKRQKTIWLLLHHRCACGNVNVLKSAGLNACIPNLDAMPVSVDAWLKARQRRLAGPFLADSCRAESGVLVPVDGVEKQRGAR